MQFHKTLAMWDSQKSMVKALPKWLPESRKIEAFYSMKLKGCEKLGGDILNTLQSEYLWIKNRRPYYKVYPCIVDALCKLRLDAKFPCPDIPQGQLSIRFALGKEPSTKDGIKIGSMFVTNVNFRSPSGRESKGMTIFADLLNPPNRDFMPFHITFDPNPHHYKSVEDLIENGQDVNVKLSNQHYLAMKKEAQALAIRIALTTCMLADDPEIITPDVLSEDRTRYDKASNEWKSKAEKRAKKSGRVGWNIGKNIDMETTPHFRRPHKAVRHTGPGGTIPKIVFVKGCKVKANKLTTVPTGYVLPDGTEVECVK
jgi:hypothetical protein